MKKKTTKPQTASRSQIAGCYASLVIQLRERFHDTQDSIFNDAADAIEKLSQKNIKLSAKAKVAEFMVGIQRGLARRTFARLEIVAEENKKLGGQRGDEAMSKYA